MEKKLLDSTYINFVWIMEVFLFLKGNMLSKQLHKLNRECFNVFLSPSNHYARGAAWKTNQNSWNLNLLSCVLYIEIECVLLILSCYDVSCLISHMVRGGLHRAALPAGCVAQEKLGYGVFESNPQNRFLFFINVSWLVKFPPTGIKINSN